MVIAGGQRDVPVGLVAGDSAKVVRDEGYGSFATAGIRSELPESDPYFWTVLRPMGRCPKEDYEEPSRIHFGLAWKLISGSGAGSVGTVLQRLWRRPGKRPTWL